MNQKQAIALIDSSLRLNAELSVTIARESSGVIFEAALLIMGCLRNGGKVLFFGNGGSAADAQHLAAELVGRFIREISEPRSTNCRSFLTHPFILSAASRS